MGWERKRGKLAEFNRLLRGAQDTSFIVRQGDQSVLPSIKYVITLDSDTKLPMDTARRLVGTLSHPLNRPRFDPRLGRVTEGYGVLQPRVGVSLESASRTPFAMVFSGHVGIDPYTSAISDVYQDLFHEGSFVGKGIYEVDTFVKALEGRVPENTLLSHDLFEGFYTRTGLCTDIHLVDDYPSNYLTFSAAPSSVGPRRLADYSVVVAHRSRRERPDGAQHAAGDLRDGRFSTTCAGVSCRRRSSHCSSQAGRFSRARRCSGRCVAFSCLRSRPTCRSADRSRAASPAFRCANTSSRSATRSSPAPGRRCSRRSSCCIRAGSCSTRSGGRSRASS